MTTIRELAVEMADKHGDSLAAGLPEFSNDPVQRLRHTLAAYGPDVNADDWAIRATGGGVVPGHAVTGVTWGDLQAILDRIDKS